MTMRRLRRILVNRFAALCLSLAITTVVLWMMAAYRTDLVG
jgi:hypothetical protein